MDHFFLGFEAEAAAALLLGAHAVVGDDLDDR